MANADRILLNADHILHNASITTKLSVIICSERNVVQHGWILKYLDIIKRPGIHPQDDGLNI